MLNATILRGAFYASPAAVVLAAADLAPVSYTHLQAEVQMDEKIGPGDAAQGAPNTCVIHGVTSAGSAVQV